MSIPLIRFSSTFKGRELIFPWKSGMIFIPLLVIGIFSWVVISAIMNDGWENDSFLGLIIIFILSYFTLAHYFNTSRLLITKKHLLIEHGPLPWWRSRRKIPRDEIDQFYVEKIRGRGRGHYRLLLLLHSGKTISPFPGIMLDPFDLRSLEHNLENELGIENRPMFMELEGGSSRASVPGDTYDKMEDFFMAEKEDILRWEDKHYRVYSHREYNWDNEEDSYSIHAKTSMGQALHFYFHNANADGDQVVAYEEKEIVISETSALLEWRPFNATSLNYKNTAYTEKHTWTGKVHKENGRLPNAKQWWYSSENATSYIRIVVVDGKMRAYSGQP